MLVLALNEPVHFDIQSSCTVAGVQVGSGRSPTATVIPFVLRTGDCFGVTKSRSAPFRVRIVSDSNFTFARFNDLLIDRQIVPWTRPDTPLLLLLRDRSGVLCSNPGLPDRSFSSQQGGSIAYPLYCSSERLLVYLIALPPCHV